MGVRLQKGEWGSKQWVIQATIREHCRQRDQQERSEESWCSGETGKKPLWLDTVIKMLVALDQSGEKHLGPDHAWLFRLWWVFHSCSLVYGETLKGFRQVIKMVRFVFLRYCCVTLCRKQIRRQMRTHSEQLGRLLCSSRKEMTVALPGGSAVVSYLGLLTE